MKRSIEGGCACGAVRYRIESDPISMLKCHCRDCQRASGGGYSTFLGFHKDFVHVRGKPRFHRTKGESGQSVERGFCGDCGNPVISKVQRLPDFMLVQAASLDDPSMFNPSMELFVGSAWPWDVLHPDTKKFSKGRS